MARISILVPAYRCGATLGETLQSLQNQSLKDWEAIIVDDGSDDNSASVAESFSSSDSRISFYHTENNGVAAARNFAASKSCSEFLLPLDGDDIIAPDYLSSCLDILEKSDDVAIVYCKWKFFGITSSTPKLQFDGFRNLLVQNSIFNCALFRRSDFERIGGYDENMVFGCEDWEMWIRMLNPGNFDGQPRNVVQIPKEMFFYRQKENGHNPGYGDDRLIKATDYIWNKHECLYRSCFGSPILMAQEYCVKWRSVKDKKRLFRFL